jgi:hypothetical protein
MWPVSSILTQIKLIIWIRLVWFLTQMVIKISMLCLTLMLLMQQPWPVVHHALLGVVVEVNVLSTTQIHMLTSLGSTLQ